MRRQSGMTLIEIMITIAVIAIIVSMATLSVNRFTSLGLKTEARRLSQTIRFLRGKAITQGITIRLIYNIDASTYQAEWTRDPYTIATTEEGLLEAGKNPSAETELEGEPKAPEAIFTPAEEGILKPVSLDNGVHFKDVWMADRLGKRTEGLAATYFFPNGLVTRTVLHFRDEGDETYYTVNLPSMNGRVIVESGYVEPEELP